jgi:hypothetical protein
VSSRNAASNRDLARAALCYIAITALLFRNLLPHATTNLYADLGDPLLNTAVMAWNATHVPLTRDWWNFPSFAPLSGVTAFTEHLLGAYPLASPIIWITGNAVLAYNVVLLLCFPLNAIAAYALVRELTGSAAGAFIGGLAFAFAPYQAAHLSHLQTLMAFGMPLTLLGLHRYLRTGAAGALAWFVCGWLCVLLSNAYALVFFPILAALWALWFRPRSDWRRCVQIAVAAVLVTAPVLPLLWGYHVRQTAYGFVRSYDEVKSFGATVTGLAGIARASLLWRAWLPNTLDEGSLFPGLAILFLGAVALKAALASSLRERSPSTPSASRLIRLGAACMVVLVARIWTGPFGWHFGPIPFPPFEPYQLASFAVPILVVGVALTGRFRAAWSRRDVVFFYALAAVMMWLLALGPEPMWSAGSGIRALAYGPYWLLLKLPGAQSIRVPARAWLPAVLCLAVCAGEGAARLATYKRGSWALAALALMIVAEGWFFDPIMPAPVPVLRGLIPSGALVLDLPIGEGAMNADPEYLAVLGSYRVLNGYSGYQPPHFAALSRAMADRQPWALDRFRLLADLFVIVRPNVERRITDWLETQTGIERVAGASGWTLYRLPRSNSDPLPTMPLALPRPGRPAFAVH